MYDDHSIWLIVIWNIREENGKQQKLINEMNKRKRNKLCVSETKRKEKDTTSK